MDPVLILIYSLHNFHADSYTAMYSNEKENKSLFQQK